MALQANNFGPLTTSLYASPFGSSYIAVIAVGINLLLTVAMSASLPGRKSTTVNVSQ